MKNYKLIACVIACTVLTSCSSVEPGPGHQAVLIEKPMFFGHGGIDPDPITTGRSYIALTTNAVDVNMQPMQFPVHFDDLMSSDGVPLDFDAVIRLQIVDSVSLVKSFGERWYENNVEREFSNRVRQAVRKHGMNETAIQTTAVDAIDTEVTNAMNKYLNDAKIPVKLLQVTVGKANPPDSIKSQRIETATQQQRILTEGQKKLAEDSRKSAELSRAEADNAYRNAMSLSQTQFLQLETIKMQRDVCSSGKCSFLVNSSSSPVIVNAER